MRVNVCPRQGRRVGERIGTAEAASKAFSRFRYVAHRLRLQGGLTRTQTQGADRHVQMGGTLLKSARSLQRDWIRFIRV